MKRNLIRLLLLVVCYCTTSSTNAQDAKVISDSLVKQSILTFVKLVDSMNVQRFGVKDLAELRSLKAGRQFKNFMISLSDIRNFKQGDDVRKIIKEFSSIEVSLVNTSGNILTSIEFARIKEKWTVSGYGLTSELIALKSSQNSIPPGIFNTGTLIRIPALRVSFFSVSSFTGLDFICLEDNPKFNFKKGQRIPASEAILKLVPIANKQKGLPT